MLYERWHWGVSQVRELLQDPSREADRIAIYFEETIAYERKKAREMESGKGELGSTTPGYEYDLVLTDKEEDQVDHYTDDD